MSEYLLIEGLPAGVKLALPEELGEEHVSFDPPPLDWNIHPEPATITLLILSHGALVALSAYLLKNRTQAETKLKNVTIVTQNGDKIHIGELTSKFTKETTNAEVVKALNSGFNGALDSYIRAGG